MGYIKVKMGWWDKSKDQCVVTNEVIVCRVMCANPLLIVQAMNYTESVLHICFLFEVVVNYLSKLLQVILIKGCTRNFKWKSMQKWQCPIYNGSRNLIKYELDMYVFASLKLFISFVVSAQKWYAHFLLIRNKRKMHRNKYFLSQIF